MVQTDGFILIIDKFIHYIRHCKAAVHMVINTLTSAGMTYIQCLISLVWNVCVMQCVSINCIILSSLESVTGGLLNLAHFEIFEDINTSVSITKILKLFYEQKFAQQNPQTV